MMIAEESNAPRVVAISAKLLVLHEMEPSECEDCGHFHAMEPYASVTFLVTSEDGEVDEDDLEEITLNFPLAENLDEVLSPDLLSPISGKYLEILATRQKALDEQPDGT